MGEIREKIVDNIELHATMAYPHHKKIAIFCDAYDHRDHRVTSIHSPVYEEREMFADSKPLVTIDRGAAQKLFQSLWNMGYRPASQDGNVGMLQATQEHLTDMKKIASKFLKVEL